MIGSGGGPGGYGSDWEFLHLDTATRLVRATARETPMTAGSRREEGSGMMVEGGGETGADKASANLQPTYIFVACGSSKQRADDIENCRARL